MMAYKYYIIFQNLKVNNKSKSQRISKRMLGFDCADIAEIKTIKAVSDTCT